MNNSDTHVLVVNPAGASPIVLVCEHASPHIPAEFAGLGLSPDDRMSHAVWDPGAMPVTEHMSKMLDAVAVTSGVSRLIYDCNRPPTASDAMPERSEVVDVPGNQALSPGARAQRVTAYYLPFLETLRSTVAATTDPVIVTIHSFTPIYHGRPRSVEIGVLHDSDTRLADAMMQTAAAHLDNDVQRNAPYGAGDGVTHTLQEHGLKHGHLNVMLEIRNDLIATPEQQLAMARSVSRWVADACARLGVLGGVQCRA
ncbi:MAG: N-formylglutamate amidohydrolase [Sulfitobacter sp.]